MFPFGVTRKRKRPSCRVGGMHHLARGVRVVGRVHGVKGARKALIQCLVLLGLIGSFSFAQALGESKALPPHRRQIVPPHGSSSDSGAVSSSASGSSSDSGAVSSSASGSSSSGEGGSSGSSAESGASGYGSGAETDAFDTCEGARAKLSSLGRCVPFRTHIFVRLCA